MFKYLFALIIFIHGIIHFMGFAKAFGYGVIKQLTLPISKITGLMWMFTALLFITTIVLLLLKKDSWIFVALPAVMISQALILLVWKEAKYGTIPNILVFIVAVLAFTTWAFERSYKRDVKQLLQSADSMQTDLLTEKDIQDLPLPVKNYLQYCNVIGKPKVKNMRLRFEGKMRSKTQDWFNFSTEQYSFFEEPARLFFMKGKMKGIMIPGYHHYKHQTAVMDIRLFGLKKLAFQKGDTMNKAETVTFFNDMCLMAPAALIDKRIRWETLDSKRVKASFTNGQITVTAVLYFNKKGELTDFISEDRFDVSTQQWISFSTPVSEYRSVDSRKIIGYGEAIWHYKDSPFVYGKFQTKAVEYNVTSLK